MNETPTPSVSLPAVLAVLRRHRLLIVLTVLLAVSISLIISATTDPAYKADSVISFNDQSNDLQVLGTPAAPNFEPAKQAAAQAERITRADVTDRVRRRLGESKSTGDLQDSISTEVQADSNLITITAEGSSGGDAAELANAFAAAVRDDTTQGTRSRYRAAAEGAQRRADRLKGVKNAARRAVFEDQASRLQALATLSKPVDIVRAAQPPADPSSPRPVRNALLAAVIGLILGIGIAFLRHVLDVRLRDPDDVEDAVDLPVVGLLRTKALGQVPLGMNGGSPPGEEDVEPYRILRTNIAFLSSDTDIRLTLVTSPLPEEGKSTVAAGLAWAEAAMGRRALLIECDLRRPTIAARLGVTPAPGLSDYLLGEATPSEILRTLPAAESGEAPAQELVCIPAGRPVPNHAKLLESARFRSLLADVRGVYDRVVLDTPPLLSLSDTLALLPQVEGILVCLRLGQTTKHEALAAKTVLERFPKKPVGVVLTGADKRSTPYYAGYYTAPALQETE